jgi:hypothetical protein
MALSCKVPFPVAPLNYYSELQRRYSGDSDALNVIRSCEPHGRAQTTCHPDSRAPFPGLEKVSGTFFNAGTFSKAQNIGGNQARGLGNARSWK